MSGTPDSVERFKFERPKLGLEKSIQKRISSENFCHKFASESFNGSANRKKKKLKKGWITFRSLTLSLSHSLTLSRLHTRSLSLSLSISSVFKMIDIKTRTSGSKNKYFRHLKKKFSVNGMKHESLIF